MPTVAITGASGFIGSRLVQRFQAGGWHVRALARNDNENFRRSGVTFYAYQLGQELPSAALEGCNVLIHAAHDFSAHGAKNFEATQLLVDQCQKSRIGRLIFISSMSSDRNARSIYGQVKWRIEQTFLQVDGLCVRPGLVLGDGGLFSRLKNFARKFPIIPLVSGGKQNLRVVYIDDLVEALFKLTQQSDSGLWVLADPAPVTFRRLMTVLVEKSGKHRLFVNVPYTLVFGCLLVAEKLFPSLGLSTENLHGLVYVPNHSLPAPAEYQGIVFRSLSDALDRLL